MTPKEIHQHICTEYDLFERRCLDSSPQNWEVLRSELLAWIRMLDKETAFAGLLSILESEDRHPLQYIAGELLDKADIRCPITLEEFMRKVLPLWNLSAGTVPKYTSKVFGHKEVLEYINTIENSGATWPNRGAAKGVKYHLGINE